MEMISLLQPVVLIIGALFVLIRGADVFLSGVMQLCTRARLQPFIIGALVIGVGTALPELAASMAAVIARESEMVIANVVGSGIVNILFVVGLMAVVAGRIVIRPQVLTAELPLFVLVHALFFGVIFDRYVTSGEAIFLLLTCGVYIWHTVREDRLVLPVTSVTATPWSFRSVEFIKICGVMGLGLCAVLLGAHYTVTGVTTVASLLSLPTSIVSMTLLALATALPEMAVALQAVRQGQPDIAIGSIFGANIYMTLVVVGIPALFVTLPVATVVSDLGVWCLYAASLVFVVVLMSRQILRSEGIIMLIGFCFFLIHLTQFM
jgi:cation:H+ antiporter